MASSIRALPGAAIRHPIALCALALWLINDHLLKGWGPGWLTGKLSDVVCLIVVPLIPVAIVELWCSRGGRAWQPARKTLIAALIFTGMVMVTINVFNGAAMAYRHGLALLQWPFRELLALALHQTHAPWRPVQLTMDPIDLLTLPALWIAWRIHTLTSAQHSAPAPIEGEPRAALMV